MGHQVHFLERLSRLSPADVELALGLYRDPPLVKAVLAQAGLPEGDGRVAISLGRDGGPWLVVERDGAFVTCLAAEMKHALPVVSRAKLDAIAQREKRLRVCMEASRLLTGDERPSAKFMLERLNAGPRLSSEAWLAMEAWRPVLEHQFLRAALEWSATAAKLTRQLVGVEQYGRRHAELFERREAALWKAAHLLVLGASKLPESVELIPELRPKLWSLFAGLLACGYAGPAFRGLWAVGRVGHCILPELKARDTEAEASMDIYLLPSALVAIGAAHAKYRAELAKVLARRPKWMARMPPGPENEARCGAILTMRAHATEALAKNDLIGLPADALDALLSQGVPEEELEKPTWQFIAGALWVNQRRAFDVVWTQLELMMASMWVPRVDAVGLVLPEAVVKETKDEPTPFEDHVIAIGTSKALLPFGERPVPVEPGAGRNAPCPCGSGRKRKRCCGEREAA